MPHLLHIDSSVLGEQSVSRRLTARAAERWRAARPGGTVTYRDLATDPIPHLDAETGAARHLPAELRTPAHQASFALSAELIDEIKRADTVLLGLPLYNYGPPSAVKAWIDHIVAPGLSTDPETGAGLVGNTDFIVLASRGGGYGPGTPREGWDHNETWLPHAVAPIGLQPQFITAELTATAVNPALAELKPLAEASLANALNAIDQLWSPGGRASDRRLDRGLMTSHKPDLGRFGIFAAGVTPAQAKEFEALGYGAVWVAGSPAPELAWAEPALAQTTTLQLATGVINIWTAAPETAAQSFHRIDNAYPGRFVLGVGVGGPEANADYRKPIDALNAYLDKLDEYGVPQSRRIVAAMGPQMLKLSASRSAGAHPYLTTPEHTAQARELIGPEAFLAPEASVVLTTDAAQARAIGRKSIEMNLILSSYVNNLKRMGFTAEDLARPGSDRLVEGVIAYGTAETVAARLREHLDAGADHIAVQVLAGPAELSPALAELAAALGLK